MVGLLVDIASPNDMGYCWLGIVVSFLGRYVIFLGHWSIGRLHSRTIPLYSLSNGPTFIVPRSAELDTLRVLNVRGRGGRALDTGSVGVFNDFVTVGAVQTTGHANSPQEF
jgi:hypothetical protein